MAWTVGAERHKQLAGGWAHAVPETLQRKWFFKRLSFDPDTGAETLLFRHSAGLRSPAAGYHTVFEESFLLEGGIYAYEDSPQVPNPYTAGCYFFRPPGWVHDSEMMSEEATLILRMVSGHDARLASEWDLIGRNVLLPIAEAVEPRGYIRCLQSKELPWISAAEFIAMHEWAIDLTYAPKERLWFKLLSQDKPTGASTVLIKMARNFNLPTAGAYTTSQELFVVEGECTIGERLLRRGAYSFRPAGYVEGPIEAQSDVIIFCRFGGQVVRDDAALGDTDQLV